MTFEYKASGIKTSALYETDADADGTYESSTKTEFLSAPSNFTGYSHVLKETKYDSSGGKPGFNARQAGLLLISTGDYERGFALYNFGYRLISSTFSTIDQFDSIIGAAYVMGMVGVGAFIIARRFDDLPSVVQSLVGFGRENSKRFEKVWRKGFTKGCGNTVGAY